MNKTSTEFQKNSHKTVEGVSHTMYPLSIYFDSNKYQKTTKLDKTTSPLKFQKNRHKIVRAVAYIRYLLYIHFECNNSLEKD